LHARFGTPVNSILLCAVVALLALKLDVTTSTSFINFGAFLAFSLVNLSVIFHYWIGAKQRGLRELVLFLVFPIIGLVADLWLMVSLDHLAIYLGLSWLAIGLVYLGFLTRGFSQQPPEMDFQEAA
jgi:amino acid transporter